MHGYGMTEAPGIPLTPLGLSADNALAGGEPALIQNVRVVDASKDALPCRQPGEISTRRPTHHVALLGKTR
jgi:hypothetical protein